MLTVKQIISTLSVVLLGMVAFNFTHRNLKDGKMKHEGAGDPFGIIVNEYGPLNI